MGNKYTQKTLAALREQGCVVGITERFNPFAGMLLPSGKRTGHREDLFGFVDIIALRPTGSIVAIQSTGPSGHAAHKRKILDNGNALIWLRCGGRIELWSWRKLLVEKGGKLRRWRARVEEITASDFK